MTQTITAWERQLTQTHAQTTRLGLAVYRPVATLTGQVTGTADGATTVNITGVAEGPGGFTPNKHYTVIVGTAPGLADIGKVRYKGDGFPIGSMEVSANNVAWSANPYFSILQWIEPWSILPDLGNDFMDGDIPYDGVSNSNYHPLGRIGPPAVGYTDQPVKFYAEPQVVAANATISSHAWTFPGGSPSSSTSQGAAASPIEVTWSSPTGHFAKYISYQVTDSNGRTHTRYNPVFIFDSLPDMYCDLEITNLQVDWSSGFASMSITVRDGGHVDDFPEDALVVLAAQDWYGAIEQSVGGNWTHRENVLYTGYILSGSVQLNADTDSVSFDTVGPIGMAEKLLSWPANLEDDGSPDTWSKLKNMTTGKAAFHILTERTTLDHIHDINYDDGRTLKSVDIPETRVKTQLDDYCVSAARQRVVSDFQGNIYMIPDVDLMETGDRASIPTTAALEKLDARDEPGINLAKEDQVTATAQVDFIGFSYDGQDATPLYSIAPGNQFEHGDVPKIDGIRVDDQTESNVVAGLYLAQRNNIFTEILWPLFNLRIFDIAPLQYATASFDGSDNPRGIVWTNQKIVPRSVTYTYSAEHQRLDVDPIFAKDSFGPPGIAGYYPSAPPTAPTPLPPKDTIIPKLLVVWDETNGTWVRNQWLQIDGGLSAGDLLDQAGYVDPFWRKTKKSTYQGDAILYKTVAGKVFKTTNGGGSWTDVTPSSRYGGDSFPNDWGLVTPPTFSDFDIRDFFPSFSTEDLIALLGNYEQDTDAWISFLAWSDVAAAAGNSTWQLKAVRQWWDGADIDTDDVAAVYNAVGVADLAASQVNLNAPGAEDLTVGTAPTHDPDTGWTFTSGGDEYLISPIETDLSGNLCVFIRLAAATSAANLFGVNDGGDNVLTFSVPSAGSARILKEDWSGPVVSTAAESVIAIVRLTDGVSQSDAVYQNGVLQGSTSTLRTFTQNLQMYLGAANTGAGPTGSPNATVLAFALFDGPLTHAQVVAISNHMAGIRAG